MPLKKSMEKQVKQLLPLIDAIGSADYTLRSLKVLYEGLMEDIENGDTPAMMEQDTERLKQAEIALQMVPKHLKDFKGGIRE